MMGSELVRLAANLSEGRRGDVVSVSTDRAAELLASGLAESPTPADPPTDPSFLTATED